ncbi:Gfo/Idh/MocA family oxidoreductase [Halobacillus salinarum]|uniref:Gfo/Idh/MocA family oxidoreductase n=1 Tax=Halobacillus salinarum TaxID=2932257 RepID=A0ABY4EKX2_9BACI|nr:Gfo/Idh/MocA family oxidoreductase [Halobacillus salinarum]UOQ45113.1 Gfo/Idh/MocA family oxidoreductase [Halobacillus salinarum]
MIRFGIIGTNTITEKLLEAASTMEEFKLTAVYSRTEEKAKTFARKYGAEFTFTSVEEFANSDSIDAVYIASPNAFHAEQAVTCMSRGKHVLCEKPLASNQQEAAVMMKAAKEHKVVLMEAVKSTLHPGFIFVQENLHKLGKIRRYVGNFCKYSSRYDAYKEGTILNAFNPKFSNGSLMDLGVYGIYPMAVLFGQPSQIQASGVKLESGVDGEGSILASYNDMEAVIMHSKIINSFSASEIQGEKGTMIIPNISEPEEVSIQYTDGEQEEFSSDGLQHPMYYEMKEFIKIVEEGKDQSQVNSLENSLITAQIIQEARHQIGISFPADHHTV